MSEMAQKYDLWRHFKKPATCSNIIIKQIPNSNSEFQFRIPIPNSNSNSELLEGLKLSMAIWLYDLNLVLWLY